MAKTKSKSTDKDLYKRLRESGVRKKVARQVSKLQPAKNKPQMKAARRIVHDLNTAATDIKDAITSGPQKRSDAAKKGAKTRKRNAAKKKKHRK